MVKMVFDRWNALNNQFDTILASLTDEQLQREIAPGKNRGIYILGHLIAVHDMMLPLLDMGDKLYPELYPLFIESADKTATALPSAAQLREMWRHQSDFMRQKSEMLNADDWLEKHTAVSAEDFMDEPHRNKLNIILTRASHLAWHLGQFILLK